MRYRTDFWLWLVLFWPTLLALGSVRWPPAANAHSLWGNTRLVAQGRWSASDGSLVLVQALFIASLAFLAGWAGQALAQACGLRLTRPPSRVTAADYDDGSPPPPPRRRRVPDGRPRGIGSSPN
jgi:hypothetical protein